MAAACMSSLRLVSTACPQSFQRQALRVCPSINVQRRRLGHRSVSACSKQIISTESAPAAVGPYSQAVKVGNTVYCSGQVALVPGTKELSSSDVEGQTEQVLKNLGAVLEAAGSSFENVVKTTVLLVDIGDFAKVNAIYGRYFASNPPARACYAVKSLPLGALVEIEAIALAP